MRLKVGQRARFRAYNGVIITGKVLTILRSGVYLVVGDDSLCGTYTDGLYRFQDRNIVR